MNTYKTLIMALSLTTSVFTQSQAASLACGAVITSDIVLTHDLVCNSGSYALMVKNHNVDIDLNGFNISGGIKYGIYVSKVNNLSIHNGVIENFKTKISINTSNNFNLTNVVIKETLLGGHNGVIINNSSNSHVFDNEFNGDHYGLSIKANFPGNSVTKHTIENNVFRNIYWNAITLRNTKTSVLKNNYIYDARFGVYLGDSNSNTISDNSIAGAKFSGISIHASSYNLVSNNHIISNGNVKAIDPEDVFSAGILIEGLPQYINNNAIASTKNIIFSNHITGYDAAVELGYYDDEDSYLTNKNVIEGNKLYNNGIGIQFNQVAEHNTSVDNKFLGTYLEIYDFGINNQY